MTSGDLSIMDHLSDTVRGDDLVLEDVLAKGQREQLGQAVAVELELAGGDRRDRLASIRQVRVEETLDALVRRAECASVLDEEMLLLLVGFQNGVDEGKEIGRL
jgi:hypothetical protein